MMFRETLWYSAFAYLYAILWLCVSIGPCIAETASKGETDSSCEMALIPGGEFEMGGVGTLSRRDEFPVHKVRVKSFLMDRTEVTNGQFKAFVDATGYVTTAERKPDWLELKKQLPPNWKPPQKELRPGSLVFTATRGPVSLRDYSQWWKWVEGADWRHPEGPSSSIIGKEEHPVVQVSWDDAAAYCKWAGKRLPTEAEWEYAARGGMKGKEYSWGNKAPEDKKPRANLWQGGFPFDNKGTDKYFTTAPVKSFSPNGYGLFDMIGNVWEWCSDWYRSDYYSKLVDRITENPQGPSDSFDPDEPGIDKRVKRGGSFLCCESYCSSYRPSARMKSSPDSAQNHLGFRCVKDIETKSSAKNSARQAN
jgi:formylglycine-generating enzyme